MADGEITWVEGEPQEVRVAQTMARHGQSAAEVTTRMGARPKWVAGALRHEAAVTITAEAMIAQIEARLREGECAAAETLRYALEAEMPVITETGLVMVPDWGARLRAANSLLDRAGQRGKAVERIVKKVASEIRSEIYRISGTAEEDRLRGALADPGVRAWLDQHTELRGQLQQMPVLPAPLAGTSAAASADPTRDDAPVSVASSGGPPSAS